MENGEAKYLPGIVITWDAEAQMVNLRFEPTEFKTWQFVVMILEGALDDAKFKMNIIRAQSTAVAAREQAMQMAQQQQIRRSLRGG